MADGGTLATERRALGHFRSDWQAYPDAHRTNGSMGKGAYRHLDSSSQHGNGVRSPAHYSGGHLQAGGCSTPASIGRGRRLFHLSELGTA